MEDNQENVQNEVNNVEQKVNENKPEKSGKGKTIVLMIILLLLVLAIGLCGGYLLSNKNSENSTNGNENKTEQSENNSTGKKIDESKDWVYDAEYGNNKTVKTIEPWNSEVSPNSKDDLVVPYININSDDAKKANEEIENLYNKKYEEYGKMICRLNYKYYINDKILSVIIDEGNAAIQGGTGLCPIYVYNFNLDTLEIASLEEMAKLCGFDSELDVQNKVKEWEQRQNDLAKANPDKVAAQMNGVVNGQYFIDKDKKLNFVYISAAAGTYYTPAVVEPNKEIEDFYNFDNDDNSEANSIQDFSLMKNAGFANTVYETEKKQGETYYKVSFDSDCNPTIYIEDVGIQTYATYNKFYNIKSDKTAGTTYITFDYKVLNETEDGGKGEIQYVNVADITIKLNYPHTDYITLQKVTTSNNNKTVTETDKEYAKEYIKIIDKIESEYPNSDLKYDLIYFNNDEIPDLVTNETSVYVYKDGKIYTPIENVPTGIGGSKFIDYYEKKSVAVSFGTGDAGLECGETFFLFNEKNEKDEYSYTTKGADAEDEEMKKRQEEALKLYGGYRHGGEKITEQEFVKKLREYGVEFDTEKLWNTKAPERKALEALRTTEDVKSELRMVK